MLIGEVSRRSGVSVRMLRHYDTLGLVVPTGRTTGGYREYSADDIRRLFHVECLRTLGLSLTDAKRALDEPGFAPATLVADLIGHTRARIRAEEELLARLLRVDASAPADWSDVLQVVSLLHALESDSGGHRQRAVLTQDESAPVPVAALVEALLAEDDPNVAGALQWSLVHTFRICGTQLIVERAPEVLPNTSYVIVSNHQSMFDIPILGSLFFSNFPKYISKRSLGRRIPSVSYNLRKGGHVLIDRSDGPAAVAAIRELGQRVAAGRCSAMMATIAR